MCGGIFSKPKAPATPPPPPPAPVVTPSEVSPQAAEETKRKQLDKMRYGYASTIKTGPRGITGGGADLVSGASGGKGKLGA